MFYSSAARMTSNRYSHLDYRKDFSALQPAGSFWGAPRRRPGGTGGARHSSGRQRSDCDSRFHRSLARRDRYNSIFRSRHHGVCNHVAYRRGDYTVREKDSNATEVSNHRCTLDCKNPHNPNNCTICPAANPPASAYTPMNGAPNHATVIAIAPLSTVSTAGIAVCLVA